MVARELSTPASTTTRTQNMAVQQSGRTSAAAHTAWRRPLICAVSVAATLCCFFVPGAVSPMPPYIPAERGWHVIESGKYDSLENHPPTLLDNAPVLDKAYEIVREFFPSSDELLKQDFVDADAELDESSRFELTSKDVERCLGAVRPNLRANAAKCLQGIKMKDFLEMARALLRHTDLNQPFDYGKSLNEFIREDDLKREMKTKFRRGYVTASEEEQRNYSAKPSDVSDDLETWVQASIKFWNEPDISYFEDPYEEVNNLVDVHLTLHPNVKPNEPEGSILYYTASYVIDENGEIGEEACEEWFGITDTDHGNSTGKPGKGANATAYFAKMEPSDMNKRILNHELANSMWISKPFKRKLPSEERQVVKRARGLGKMDDSPMQSNSCNKINVHYNAENHWYCVKEFEKPTDSIRSASLEVVNEVGEEDYPCSDELTILRELGTGQRQFKSFEIARKYCLVNSDCLDKPFYRKPTSRRLTEGARRIGKYRETLGFHQKYSIDDALNEMKINIGFVLDRWGFSGTVCSPICFELERLVKLAPPGGKDETIEVKKLLSYKTDEHESVLHMSHLTKKGFKAGSFVYETEDLFPSPIREVAFLEKIVGTTIPGMIPVRYLECEKECEPESPKRRRTDDLSEALSVNDGKGQKSSLLGTTLFDGGLLFFGIITVFVLLAATFESSRKGKKVRTIQSRVVDSSKNNIVEGQ